MLKQSNKVTTFVIDKKVDKEAATIAKSMDLSKGALFRRAVRLHLAQLKAESQAIKNV